MDGRKWTANTPENVDGFAIHMARSYISRKNVDGQNVDVRQVGLQDNGCSTGWTPSYIDESCFVWRRNCGSKVLLLIIIASRQHQQEEQPQQEQIVLGLAPLSYLLGR